MEIKAFKMISGEEVIGKLIEVVPDGWIVEKVRLFVTQPTAEGQLGVGFLPYVVSNMDGNSKIRSSAVACEPDKVVPEVEKIYLQQVSPIQLPSVGGGKSIITR